MSVAPIRKPISVTFAMGFPQHRKGGIGELDGSV
jgi:hypothetical protein